MSKSRLDNDGFQFVTSKRSSKKNKQTKIPRDFSELRGQENPFVDIEKAKRLIKSAIDDLHQSSYLESVFKSVSTHLHTRKVEDIICFGLGHIGECAISQHQTALLLCLKDYFTLTNVFVHDPIFYKSECDILKDLGLKVIKENNEGNYIINSKDVTIAYFPHCPKQLTNNFLWSNWGKQLENCILICNSFSTLFDNNPSRVLIETVPYIHKIFPHTKETALENNFKHTDIFNDTAVHSFPSDNLSKLDPDFWIKMEKPEYQNSEEFITSLMIEKLTI